MRKITKIFLIIISLYFPVHAQSITMSIGRVSAKPGDTVLIPINVTNFNNVGAISLSILYDAEVLTYAGIVNQPAYGNFTNNPINGTIIVGWFSNIPLTIGNGKLADFMFIYNKESTEISFNLPLCEIADSEGNTLAVKYNNGSVAQEDVSVKEDYKTVEFSLSRNYPNPFNPATRIDYSIPSESDVNLSVYSVTGELIKELVNKFQLPGYYSVNFDSGILANGVYVYRIRAGNYMQSNKMLLLK